ncbi:hypothetical protein LMG18090_01231 [Ralstonia mannitolilytica]|uniref:DUF2169 family type VI secretion system accessory protein n=1 Tax=Ralstonia mannitolilytica TaxID=105219 RepID=UPI0028F5681C|nr:DUF2169 domain-containing protein [Ralstonia mannitolilytica]CAJ0780751.1 hypothetical protein LMG18090_01231 [Ralstonia mannitolilytica]
MEFVNHTPFPALAFAGIDQFSQTFHVVALRQTLSWNDAGELEYVEDQAPLCESDEFFGEALAGSVRQESDLCHYKPRCDVIVNAVAHAPVTANGKPPSRFDVRLRVHLPDAPAALPLEPHGLNPLMPASPEEMAQWRHALESAKRSTTPGKCLIDKTLTVTGERFFAKRAGLQRLAATLVKVSTLGLVRLPSWRLTAPAPLRTLPVRLEQAFGGECRIDANSKAASRVPKKHRLTPEQVASHPEADTAPVAHASLAANPIGRGFATGWHLDATGMSRVPAPQIEDPAQPITLRHFNQARAGDPEGPAAASKLVVGLGIRPKGHPDRAKLTGTVDEEFISGDAPLPKDFDFAVWNAAWPDQQVDALSGGEVIELVNLCAHDTPAARMDADGNCVLRLQLKQTQCMLVVRMESGFMFLHPLKIDTLMIEPDQRRVTLVWRAVLGDAEPIRKVEAQLFGTNERVFMEEMAALARERRAGKPAPHVEGE